MKAKINTKAKDIKLIEAELKLRRQDVPTLKPKLQIVEVINLGLEQFLVIDIRFQKVVASFFSEQYAYSYVLKYGRK